MKRMMVAALISASTLFAVPAAARAQEASAAPANDNQEMARIFEADQAIRQRVVKHFDPKLIRKMSDDDLNRKTRTRKLLDTGALTTGEDFYRAAFIFQHGDDPADYLLAHSLALASAARGTKGAAWIAAATLDRYLMAIGKKQIFGTQYVGVGPKSTMEPHDRDLIPDALRKILSVSTMADQRKRLAELHGRED